MKQSNKNKKQKHYYILSYLLLENNVTTIYSKIDGLRYVTIWRYYKNLQKKVFDKYSTFSEINSKKKEIRKKPDMQFLLVLYDYVHCKNVNEVQLNLKKHGIDISTKKIYYYNTIAKKMIENYCANHKDEYIKYLKSVNPDAAIFEGFKTQPTQEKQVQQSENDDTNIQAKTSLSENFGESKKIIKEEAKQEQENNTMSFAQRLKAEQEKQKAEREKREKQQAEKEKMASLYDKREVIGDREYAKIVISELEEIAKNPDRLPLYPNDYAYPYKKELWYKAEEVPPIDDEECFTYEHIVVGAQARKEYHWDEEHPFPYLQIFGTLRTSANSYNVKYIYSYCREAKKGSATRGYISHVVRDAVEKLHEKTAKSKKELDLEVDNILKEWEYPKEKVKITLVSGIKKYYDLPIKEFKSREEEDAMDDKEFKQYWKKLHSDAYDNLKTREEKIERSRYIQKRLGLYSSRFEDELSIKREYASKAKGNDPKHYDYEDKNFKEIMRYNNAIAISKLEFLFERLNDKYETSFNILDSIELLKSIKTINEKK